MIARASIAPLASPHFLSSDSRLGSRSLLVSRCIIAGIVASLGACNCDDNVAGIAPQIYLDACAKPARKINDVLVGGYEECGVSFGSADISTKVTRDIKVTNPSTVELVLLEVQVIGDPAFKLELGPETIGPGLSAVITVSARPRTETDVESHLTILSNANNTPQTPAGLSLIDVPLTANGVDNGIPDLQLDSACFPADGDPAIDFAKVAVQGVKVCAVSIKNVGTKDLVVDDVKLVPLSGTEGDALFDVPPDNELSPFAVVGRPPSPDEPIAAGASITMPVRFTPDVLGHYSGRLEISSNDPDDNEAVVHIPLDGLGVTPPTCAIRLKSVNGVDAGPNQDVEPLDDVVITADGSATSTANGTIVSYTWSVTQKPAGSQVVPSNANGAETGFLFAGNVHGVDLAGSYTIAAKVTDELGVQSVNECAITFDAVPKDHFLVQLSWDSNADDIDLHVTKMNDDDQYCVEALGDSTATGLLAETCTAGLDCNFSSCRLNTSLEDLSQWDALPGRTAGDPSLDIDDTNGFGPENINIDAMPAGNYLVSVVYWDGSAAGGTVRLFVFGRLVGEFVKDIVGNEFWEVAMVEWPEDINTAPVCIEDLTDGDATDDIVRCHENYQAPAAP